MEGNSLPLYEVEFLPVERRLTDRRQSGFDLRTAHAGTAPAPERRPRERRLQDRRGLASPVLRAVQ